MNTTLFIPIIRGDDTGVFVNLFKVVLIPTPNVDLTGFTGKFYVGRVTKELSAQDIAARNFIINFTKEETSQLALGDIKAELELISPDGEVTTIISDIPFTILSGQYDDSYTKTLTTLTIGIDISAVNTFICTFDLRQNPAEVTNELALVSDKKVGYTMVRWRQEQASNVGNSFLMFNKDRTKRLYGTAASPSGGSTITAIFNYDSATGTQTQISNTVGSLGQTYPFAGNFGNFVEIAKDDSHLIAATGAGFTRVDVSPNYASINLKRIYDSPTLISNWHRPRIIDATHFASYNTTVGETQKVLIFVYDGFLATIEKTINVGFDIKSLAVIENVLCVIGDTQIAFYNITTQALILSAISGVSLFDVFATDKYFFIKTTSDIAQPLRVFEKVSDTLVNEKLMNMADVLPAYSMISRINVIRDDNASEEKFLVAFHTNNGSFGALAVHMNIGVINFISMNAAPLAGNMNNITPEFLTPNLMVFYTSFTGLPVTIQTVFFKYAEVVTSLKMDGNTYSIASLA